MLPIRNIWVCGEKTGASERHFATYGPAYVLYQEKANPNISPAYGE